MKLQDLRDENLTVWGAGRDGLSVLRQLRKRFPEKKLSVFSDQPISQAVQSELEMFGPIRIVTGGGFLEKLTRAEVVIKSPGISLYRDDVTRAKEKGVRFLSSTNLWFAEMGEKPVIAVTGTKGKSTTASLIYHGLSKLGVSAELIGNIGKPLLAHLDGEAQMVVVELSSYQTADIQFSPRITVLVNLFPEHVDWHGSTENYYRDKLRLFHPAPGRHTILNFKDPETRRRTGHWSPVLFFEKKETIHAENGEIWYGDSRLGVVSNSHLKGTHNLSNICAALTALAAAGYDPVDCLALFKDFVGLPHRQEILGLREGLTYVDDSISTTPETAMAAIHRFNDRPLTILLGGFDREQAYGTLAKCLCENSVHTVITLPDNGARITEAIRLEIERCGTGPILLAAEDLPSAVILAQRHTPGGGVVLLSPAAPSYGNFANYEERGECFRRVAGFGSSSGD